MAIRGRNGITQCGSEEKNYEAGSSKRIKKINSLSPSLSQSLAYKQGIERELGFITQIRINNCFTFY